MNEKAKQEIVSLLKARNPLLWIQSTEEKRVEELLTDAAGTAGYDIQFWDCASGMTDVTGTTINQQVAVPDAVLRLIRDTERRTVYVLRDLHRWFTLPTVVRALRTLARKLQLTPPDKARAIVLITPVTEIPPELEACSKLIEFPLPDREELAKIINRILRGSKGILRDPANPINGGSIDLAIDAALGLQAEQAEACFAHSIVQYRCIDPAIVFTEKRRVIAASRVLTWYDPDPRGLEAIGGLENLKEWLTIRKVALTKEAREYGLEAPRGILLVGIPGCGKSLTAKAVATAWSMPLLRLDIGALKSKFVGESEGNIRRALSVAETVAPCIIWVDEIEKALAGATQGAADGGVSADALSTLLTWMQERNGAVFVVATANDIAALPPELLRKGRFDELFFVDLPTPQEREAILEVCLKKLVKHKTGTLWNEKMAEATDGFTGAEIEQAVKDAMFVAFNDSERSITRKDLLNSLKSIVPLSKTSADKIAALQKWSTGNARRASAKALQYETERTLEI